MPVGAFALDGGSTDHCTATDELELEMARVDLNGNLYDRAQSIAFGAEDVGNQRLALIVTDEAGNEAVCETVVQVQCGSCPSACENQDTTRKIQGAFYTIQGYHMEGVDLQLGSSTYLGKFDSPYMYDLNMLDSSGGFGNLSGELCAEKTDDVGNGVSTMDLVMIRRHILELSSFDAYQNLAADINGDEKVSTRDMVEIRKVILEIVNAFSGVPSWRMFRSDFDIGSLGPDTWSDPLDFDEEIFCYDVFFNAPETKSYNFIGLKMGDVSGDAGEDWARSGEPIAFTTDEKALSRGSIVEVSFKTNTTDLFGYQMTIEFDADVLELVNWSGELDDYNINILQAEDGLLAISKVTEGSRSNERFSLKFKVKENAMLSEVLRLSDAMARTEGYTDLQSRNPIVIDFDENEGENSLTAFPNPFEDRVVLEFNAEFSGGYQLELFNARGQKIYSQNWELITGENRQVLQREELNAASGWYLARISGPQTTETVSLILK